MNGAMLKGHLDLLLLAVVAAQPAHGYAICEELRRRSGGHLDLAEGTVYPALHRLEADGLLRSSWTEQNGRRRRLYQLTRAGRVALGDRTTEWQRFQSVVAAVLTPRPLGAS